MAKKANLIWILALACMFFAGQAWAQCTDPGDTDADGDGILDAVDNCPAIPNAGQEDEDGDDIGDVCDECLGDPTNLCNAPELIDGDPLSVGSGCVTYEGDHPVEPGLGFVQTYEFCANGSAIKLWNPDPVNSPTLPGDLVCVGTWSVTGTELAIDTNCDMLGMVMNSTETYEIAYTYDGGAKLDMFSVGQDTPGDASSAVGSYSTSTQVTVLVPGMMDMLTIADTATTVAGDGSWAASQTSVATCTGGVCTPAMNGTTVTDTSGAIALPGQLFDVDGTYVLQVDDTFVLELF
jgi:hypothetical protein